MNFVHNSLNYAYICIKTFGLRPVLRRPPTGGCKNWPEEPELQLIPRGGPFEQNVNSRNFTETLFVKEFRIISKRVEVLYKWIFFSTRRAIWKKPKLLNLTFFLSAYIFFQMSLRSLSNGPPPIWLFKSKILLTPTDSNYTIGCKPVATGAAPFSITQS